MSDTFNWADKSDAEILQAGLTLTRTFLRMQGYVVPPDFAAHKSPLGRHQLAWSQACKAFEELTGTDLQDIADNIEEA